MEPNVDDPFPLSALQHWRYCPLQCALIHLEQAFEDKVFTLRGQAVHGRADQPGVEVRAGLGVERGRSERIAPRHGGAD